MTLRGSNASLIAASIVGLEPGHNVLDPNDTRVVARINSLSDVGCKRDILDVGYVIGSRMEKIKVEDIVSGVGNNSDPLDVCNNIIFRIEKVKVGNLVSDVGCDSDSLDVYDDISSRTEQNKVEGLIDLGGDNVPCTVESTVSLKRQQCSHMGTARRDASTSPCGDGSKQLLTLVNGVTGGVDGKVSLVGLPSLNALVKLMRCLRMNFIKS